MYCLVDMYNNKLNIIDNITDKECLTILNASVSLHNVLEFYLLGKCVSDALGDLTKWSNETPNDYNHLIRNLHTAERLSRSYLFEFRTCLDHMQTSIKKTYNTNSNLWEIFKSGTNKAYDDHPEYAFTYHLRNYSQHYKNIVHGFNCTTGIGISSNVQILLSDYKEWKQIDKNFMLASGDNIDLLKTFTEAFKAFNSGLKPVIQDLLNTNDTLQKLLYLRKWGDSLQEQFQHDIHCFHIVDGISSNGSHTTNNNMDQQHITAYSIDWDMIYELSNSIVIHTPSQ